MIGRLTSLGYRALLVGVAGLALNWQAPPAVVTPHPVPPSNRLDVTADEPCSAMASSPVAILAEDTGSPVQTISESLVPAIVGYPDLYVVFGQASGDQGSVIQQVSAAGYQVGVLARASADPALQSCDYQLADSSAAQPLVSAGESALRAEGLVTAAELADPSTTLMLSDDPFNSSLKFLSVVLSTPIPQSLLDQTQPPPDPATQALYAGMDNGTIPSQPPPPDTTAANAAPPASVGPELYLHPFVAVISSSDLKVIAAGAGNWYAGQGPVGVSDGFALTALPLTLTWPAAGSVAGTWRVNSDPSLTQCIWVKPPAGLTTGCVMYSGAPQGSFQIASGTCNIVSLSGALTATDIGSFVDTHDNWNATISWSSAVVVGNASMTSFIDGGSTENGVLEKMDPASALQFNWNGDVPPQSCPPGSSAGATVSGVLDLLDAPN